MHYGEVQLRQNPYDISALTGFVIDAHRRGDAARAEHHLAFLTSVFNGRATGRFFSKLKQRSSAIEGTGPVFCCGIKRDIAAQLSEEARSLAVKWGRTLPTLAIVSAPTPGATLQLDASGFGLIVLSEDASETTFRHECAHALSMGGSLFLNEGFATFSEQWAAGDTACAASLPPLRVLLCLRAGEDLTFEEIDPTRTGAVHAFGAALIARLVEALGAIETAALVERCLGPASAIDELTRALGSLEALDARLRGTPVVSASAVTEADFEQALCAFAGLLPGVGTPLMRRLDSIWRVDALDDRSLATLACAAAASAVDLVKLGRARRIDVAALRAAATRLGNEQTFGLRSLLTGTAELVDSHLALARGQDIAIVGPRLLKVRDWLNRAMAEASDPSLAYARALEFEAGLVRAGQGSRDRLRLLVAALSTSRRFHKLADQEPLQN
jgi:hypothetical protein